MSEKKREPLNELLHDNLTFISSYSTYDNRDRMLDEIWPHVGINKVRELQIFGNGNEFMVKYKLTGQRSSTMAEYIKFKGVKIASIEVYIGFESK